MSSPITISERLDIQDGDVLILRANISEDAFNNFRDQFNQWHGDKRVAVVLLKEGEDLERLNSDALKAVGYVRASDRGENVLYHFTREMLADAYVATEPPEGE